MTESSSLRPATAAPAAVPAETMPQRSGTGRLSADAIVLIAAVVTATCSISTTSRWFNQAAVFLGGAVLLAVLWVGRITRPHTSVVVAGLLIALVPQLGWPPKGNMTRTDLFPATVALGVLAVLLLLSVYVAGRVRPRSYGVQLGLIGASAAAMATSVMMTPAAGLRPKIDVWEIFQQSAAKWLHGVNPYEMTFSNIPKGQTNNCFNYLPVSFISGWTGWVSAGDVRYAELAIMLAGWLALGYAIVRLTTGRPDVRVAGLSLVAMAATLTGTIRVAQQAWNESLVLGFLLIAVSLLLLGHGRWLWIPFALALATKQHVALLLPVAAIWPAIGWRRALYSVAGAIAVSAPWLIWNFGRFKACTVDFFIHIPAQNKSISGWRLFPPGLQTVIVVVSLLVFLALAVTRLPRTPGMLLIAFAAVQFGFDLFNKQSFENQWWFVSELLVCGLAVRLLELERRDPEPLWHQLAMLRRS